MLNIPIHYTTLHYKTSVTVGVGQAQCDSLYLFAEAWFRVQLPPASVHSVVLFEQGVLHTWHVCPSSCLVCLPVRPPPRSPVSICLRNPAMWIFSICVLGIHCVK